MQGRQPSATSQRLQQSEARRNPARATRTSISRIWKAEHVLVAARCHNIDLPIVGALCPNIDLPIVLIANIDERGLIREMGNVVSLEKKKKTPSTMTATMRATKTARKHLFDKSSRPIDARSHASSQDSAMALSIEWAPVLSGVGAQSPLLLSKPSNIVD